MRRPSRSLVVRFGWVAVPLAMGSFAVLNACSDEDPVTPGRDAGPDTRKPPSELPPPSIDTTPDPDGGVDANSLRPTPWNRADNPRDAAIEASDRFCDPAGGPGEFCWDFIGADGITGWQEVLADGGTHELSLSDEAPNALRQALRSTVLRTSGDGPKWVALRYLVTVGDIPDKTKGLTLSFSFHVGLSETYAVLGGVQVGTTVHGLAVYPGGCQGPCIGESLHDGPPPAPDVANRRPFDPNAWYRAQIRYVPTLADGKVTWGSTITVGGTVVGTRTADAFPAGDTYPQTVNVFVGAFNTQKAGNVQVEIDDVILE